VERHTRSRRLFLASALLLIGILGVAALAFREAIRERWLLWKLEHSDGDAEKDCMARLGAMGSLRAIEPLARRLEGLPPSNEWHFYTTQNVMRSLDALSALLSIAQTRREKCFPYLEKSRVRTYGPDEVLRQLGLVAAGAQESIDLSKPLVPGRDPRQE
jgi:hypothetical protein